MTTECVRELSSYELFLYILCKEFRCTTMCSMIVRIDGEVQEQRVRAALRRAMSRQPVLRARAIPHGKGMAWELIPIPAPADVPLVIVERQSEAHWQDVYDEYAVRPFVSEDNLLWRWVWIRSTQNTGGHEFILNIDHAISDARSMARLISEILVDLNGDEDLSILPSSLPFPVPFHLETTIPPPKAPEVGKWPVEKIVDADKCEQAFLHARLPADVMYSLLSKCKQEGVSLTAAMLAALGLAGVQIMGPDAVKTLHPAIDLRSYANPPVEPSQLGIYAMMFPIAVSPTKEMDVWEFARQVLDLMRNAVIVQRQCNFSIPALDNIDDVRNALRQMMNAATLDGCFVGGLSLSNLGIVEMNIPGGRLTVKDLYVATVQYGRWPLYVYTMTVRGSLHVTIAYPPPFTSRERANELLQMMFGKLGVTLSEAVA